MANRTNGRKPVAGRVVDTGDVVSDDSRAGSERVGPTESVSGSTSVGLGLAWVVSVVFARRRRPLARGQRLTCHQFAVERGMLREVADQHMATPASQSRSLDVRGRELRRQVVVEVSERGTALEHFPVARRVGTPALDDVAAVFPVRGDRAGELPALGQRFAQRRPQSVGLGAREFVGLAPDGDRERLARVPVRTRGSVTLDGEFLDQSPRGDLLYPRTPR